MTWVSDARNGLARGEVVSVRPYGGSMRGRIESGQLVTLQPTDISQLVVGDIVFVRWKGNYLLHLVMKIESERILIGNNLDVLGKVIAVGDVA